jgi:hypothetical protein
MNDIREGDRIRFQQVLHMIPMTVSAQSLEIHEDPKSGEGVVQILLRVGKELRVWVIPDNVKGKKDQIALLLRVPPDKMTLLGGK